MVMHLHCHIKSSIGSTHQRLKRSHSCFVTQALRTFKIIERVDVAGARSPGGERRRAGSLLLREDQQEFGPGQSGIGFHLRQSPLGTTLSAWESPSSPFNTPSPLCQSRRRIC